MKIHFKAYEKKYPNFSVYILETQRTNSSSVHTFYTLPALLEAIDDRKKLGVITDDNFDNQLG